MDKKTMHQIGRDHAHAGKKCTPYDCRDIDKMIFKEAKGSPAYYAEMRGAFNEGWQEAYFETTE